MAGVTVGFVCERCHVLSPMAEALARQMGGEEVEADSAGLKPAGRLLPSAATALREAGLDTTELRPSEIDRAWLESCDAVVLIGVDPGADPVFDGLAAASWDLESPDTGQLGEVRDIRDEIGVRVRELLREHGIEPRGELSELG